METNPSTQEGETTPVEKNEVESSQRKGPYDLGNLTVEESNDLPKIKKNMEEQKRGFNHDGGCY
ncbi:MAG: hypothetical protein WC089_00050 [Candidatus Paceibacterota bacterium]